MAITKEQVDSANQAWTAARARLRNTIRENQNAMQEFRSVKNSETEAGYKATRQAHKEALDHIKKVRSTYYQLKYQFDTQI